MCKVCIYLISTQNSMLQHIHYQDFIINLAMLSASILQISLS